MSHQELNLLGAMNSTAGSTKTLLFNQKELFATKKYLHLLDCYEAFAAGLLNLFTISYHLGTPYCQRVPLLPEQLI